MTAAQLSFTEAIDSLTGYEEDAIVERFGADINTLLSTVATKASRALVFTTLARAADAKAGEVFKRVQAMTISEVTAYFIDADPEPTPDEPSSDEGKDDSHDG